MTAAANPRTIHGAPVHCALPDTPLAHARDGLDRCVHCGFCLQACPTYVVLEDENDSPRGRLVLMRSLLEGARATLTDRHPLPFPARVMLGVFARPWILKMAMAGGRVMRALRIARLLSRLIPGRYGFALHMLESTRFPLKRVAYEPRPNGSRGTVALLEGCVMEGLYASTNRATERTLVVNGYRMVNGGGQRCCGALHAHAGDLDTARQLARKNIEAFEQSGADFFVSNAAGCGAMLKEYDQLLADDPDWGPRARRLVERTRDVSELLAEAGPVEGAPLEITATYDAPCHLLHAQRVSAPPLKVLAAIPGMKLVPLTDAEYCCGAAGIYNLLEPATSNAVLAPKLGHIDATGAKFVATGNPGCHMQIGAGLRRAGSDASPIHPVDLLDASYAKKFGDS